MQYKHLFTVQYVTLVTLVLNKRDSPHTMFANGLEMGDLLLRYHRLSYQCVKSMDACYKCFKRFENTGFRRLCRLYINV